MKQVNPLMRSAGLYGRSGQVMVEFAMAVMVWLLLIMAIVDFGRAFFAFNLASNIAREGARYATIPTRTEAQIIAYATAQSPNGGVTVTVVNRGTAGLAGPPAEVQASALFTPITPLISQICCSGGPLNLVAKSKMYVEI